MADGRPNPWHLAAAAALLYAALLSLAFLLLLSGADDPAARTGIRRAFAAAGGLSLLIVAVSLAALRRLVFLPLELLGRETRIVRVNPAHPIELPRGHLLGDVAPALQDLGAELARSRHAADAARSSDPESRQARLEAILASLDEGLLVCDDQARVVFSNPAARAVFRDNPALGIGRSLHLLIAPAPIEDSLRLLRQRRVRQQEPCDTESGVSFVCATLHGIILSCRMQLLPDVPGRPWSFLLTCEDISQEADARDRRESLLRATVKQMRAPLTGLGLSAESLELLPDLDAARRAELEGTIARDARRLIAQFGVLAREIEEMGSPRHLARDVFVGDLAACVAQRLEERGLRLTLIGDPLWVKADVHALLFLLEFFAQSIQRSRGAGALELETLLGDRRVYFTFCWRGAAVPQGEIEAWNSGPAGPSGAHTVGELLERLGSEVWSRPHETPGFATLSFPVPSAPGQCALQPPGPPPRAEFVDVPAPDEVEPAGARELVALDRAYYVVFDTETTGLAPRGGDEIIALAGVKIVNSGIVLGESFNLLVDPGRPIPPDATRIHGITDEQVRGRPRIEEALRAFHAFVGDAVLVGHNAAFDMRFIRLKQRGAGVRFAGPLLDTLALSRFLHDHTPTHSLDAVARRLGVEIRDRHTALGDSLITAEVFLKLLYLLRERGVHTLGRALEVSGR